MGKTKDHRYHLAIPMNLYEKLDQLAEEEATSVRDIIIRSIRLGLWYFAKKKQYPNCQIQVITPDGKNITEVLL